MLLYVSTEEYDPISIAIRAKTECAWSHVGFYNPETKRTFSAMCDGKGVAWRTLKPSEKYMLLDADGIDDAFKFALAQEGKPYDVLDIIGIVSGADLVQRQHFICSTLVLWSFQQAGKPLLGMWAIPLDHMTPRDVLLSPFIRELYS